MAGWVLKELILMLSLGEGEGKLGIKPV